LLLALIVLRIVAGVVGIVVGVGIFRAPSIVAGSSSSEGVFLALWVAGGVISLIGALCYAELGSAYPLLRDLKRALDPSGIMNPGVLLA